MSWMAQPVCIPCWNRDHPDRQTTRAGDVGAPEHCCLCGGKTRAGLYVRVDTATVPFPQEGPS